MGHDIQFFIILSKFAAIETVEYFIIIYNCVYSESFVLDVFYIIHPIFACQKCFY